MTLDPTLIAQARAAIPADYAHDQIVVDVCRASECYRVGFKRVAGKWELECWRLPNDTVIHHSGLAGSTLVPGAPRVRLTEAQLRERYHRADHILYLASQVKLTSSLDELKRAYSELEQAETHVASMKEALAGMLKAKEREGTVDT